jgi:hypothetical protein
MKNSNNKKVGKKTTQRSSNKPKQNPGGITSQVPPYFGFIKPRESIVLRYVEPISSGTIATTVSKTQVMRLNSLFDPNRTGTGHQPYGYDILGTMFNRYRVTHVWWEVSFPSNADVLNYTVAPYNGTFTPANTIADFELISENPRSSSGMTGYNGTPVCKLRGSVALNQLCGTTMAEYMSDDRFQADFGSNATEVLDLNIVIYNPSGTTLVSLYYVEMGFTCVVSDPILPAIS